MASTFGVYLRLGFDHLLDLRGYDHILFLAVLCAAYSLARWRELLILVTAFTVGHSLSLAAATLGLVRIGSGLVEFLIPMTIIATAVTNLAGLSSPWIISREHREGRCASGPWTGPDEHRDRRSAPLARRDEGPIAAALLVRGATQSAAAQRGCSAGRMPSGSCSRAASLARRSAARIAALFVQEATQSEAVQRGCSAPRMPGEVCPRAASRRGRGTGGWSAPRVRYGLALLFGVVHGLGFATFLRLALGTERSIWLPLLSFNIGLELAQIVAAAGVLAIGLAATRIPGVGERLWTAVLSAAAGSMALLMAAGRFPP